MVKEQEVVRIEDDWNKKRFFTGKRFVFLVFILIAVSLLFYAFYGDKLSSITGGAILNLGNKEDSNVSSNFEIRAELGPLNSYLDFNQNIGKISIELKKSDASLFFGKDGALNLSSLDKTTIEIEGFKGTMAFDKDKIYNLNGNIFKLVVNGLSTTSPDSNMKVTINNQLNYEFIKLDSVNVKKYNSQNERGKVVIDNGRVSLNVDDESFSLSEFTGKVESGLVGNYGIKKQGLILDGKAKGINVGGKFKIDVNS